MLIAGDAASADGNLVIYALADWFRVRRYWQWKYVQRTAGARVGRAT